MILCGDIMYVGGGGGGAGGVCPPQKDTKRRVEGAVWVQNKYVTISNRANVPEGSLSEFGNPPLHNLDKPHGVVAGNTKFNVLSNYFNPTKRAKSKTSH